MDYAATVGLIGGIPSVSKTGSQLHSLFSEDFAKKQYSIAILLTRKVDSMPIVRVKIENYKSIRNCNISLEEMNLFIGENGSGKSNLLEAIHYFYDNLTNNRFREDIFDRNNRYSNEVNIIITYDLSEFVKFAKSKGIVSTNGEFIELNEGPYKGYYKAILSLLRGNKKQISVSMSQIKGKPIKWNYSYQDRQLIRSLFPVFLIDSRQLDVQEWEYIWNMLGELAKVSNKERKKLENEIDSLLGNPNNAISRKLQSIKQIFDDANVSIRKTTSKTFAQNLMQAFFSGSEIYQQGKSLDYYSTGTNSVKYIELLLNTIDELSKKKLKEPTILLDEPEISLHHYYIDELSAAISKLTGKTQLLISTHSSRLTKNMIVSLDTVSLYNVILIDKYTHIGRMKNFVHYSPKSKYRVTDEHINSYFSKAVIFVEGETELEFFSNPYLKVLFPVLETIDVYKAVSDKPILNIMNPKKVGTDTPHIILIDMDKALSYNPDVNTFTIDSEYIKPNEKEYLQYRNKNDKRTLLYHQFKRISAMANKLKLKYDLPFYSCRDANYFELINSVKEYLWSYNVFAFRTTIEGALINERTKEFVLHFLKDMIEGDDETETKVKGSTLKAYNDFCSILDAYPTNDQTNFLRYVFKGKSDLLQYKRINKDKFKGKGEAEKIQGLVAKANGWVTRYLNSFFQEKSKLDETLTLKSFRRYLEDDENRKSLESDFKYYFPEFDSLINKIHDIMK